MRTLYSLIILIFSINITFCSIEGKNFYKEFIRVTKTEDTSKEFSEQCFGKLFDYYMLVFKMSYYQNDIITLLSSVENMIIDSVILNCPIKGFLSLIKELQESFNSTDFKTSLYLKGFKLGKLIISEYLNPEKSGASLGRTFGKMVNLFRVNFTEEEETKSEESASSDKKLLNIEDYFEFFEGLFIGMKKEDDLGESLCYKDVMQGKKEILEHVKKGMKGVEEGKGFGKAIKTILFNLMTVDGLVLDCNLLTLGGNVIGKFTSTKEMVLLYDKLITNADKYIIYIKNIFSSYKKNDLNEAGVNLGKIISSLFDFYVK